MSDIFDGHKVQSVYWDRQHYASVEEQLQRMAVSCTVYVDGLDFATPESMIYETFCKVGCIKRVIMGIDAQTKTPCGFCFVEYYRRREAMDALLYLNGTVCDGKVVKCDLGTRVRPSRARLCDSPSQTRGTRSGVSSDASNEVLQPMQTSSTTGDSPLEVTQSRISSSAL